MYGALQLQTLQVSGAFTCITISQPDVAAQAIRLRRDRVTRYGQSFIAYLSRRGEMPWFCGGSNQDDPTKSLDADLKQFLKEQQPKPYVPVDAPPKVVEPPTKFIGPQASLPKTTEGFEERPLPKESLFQDGRYKDLWKTYVPQAELAAAAATPVEHVINARKDRRTGIHRAALENCAFEQELQRACLGSGFAGSIKSRMTMCRAETKTFNRCYQLQAKFLQALGYMASSTTTDVDEEQVQMHADKLYHRMMDYEEALESARLNNQPIPPLSSVFDPRRPAPTIEQFTLPETAKRKLKTPLNDLPPHERELAARAALSEANLTNEDADEFFKYTTTMNEYRQRRQTWAVKAFGEAIGKFLIPDPPKQPGTMRQAEQTSRDVWSNERSSDQLPNSIYHNGKG